MKCCLSYFIWRYTFSYSYIDYSFNSTADTLFTPLASCRLLVVMLFPYCVKNPDIQKEEDRNHAIKEQFILEQFCLPGGERQRM
jgi:hypothetical protein